jgi:hypothetical protein
MKAEERAATGVPIGAVVVLGLVVLGGIGFWYLDRQSRQVTTQTQVLSADTKAYVQHLKLSEVQMKATETYLNQTVVEIVGKITNTGDRRLRLVEVNCVFYDPWGQVVLRERTAIVRSRTDGLGLGETRDFRLPFDDLPESWNQGMPQLVIAQIVFD